MTGSRGGPAPANAPSHPETGPSATDPRPEVRETHSGIVLLVGRSAYKIKKPVDLGFLDFRTVAARRQACVREFALNRRLAPDVYHDVATLAGSDGTLQEPVLVMRRLPDDRRLTTLVAEGSVEAADLRRLARVLSDFHDGAERGDAIAAQGRAAGLRRRWTDNLEETRRFRGRYLDVDIHDQVTALAVGYVDGRAALLDDRAAAGHVVDGHGDLLADDIFILPDGPRVLDCLEFDDRLRWVDRVDDIAFLVMDLERLGRPDLAAEFLRSYLTYAGDRPPPRLVHHYVAYRAFVRCKVACLRAEAEVPGAEEAVSALAALTIRHLRAGEVRLILVGGAPATGKTTLAAGLAPHVGATVPSTDAVRSEMSAPAANRYAPEAIERVYDELLDRAGAELARGRTVIADATWPSAARRRRARAVAAATGSALFEIECRAPLATAVARADRRRLAGSALSEADGGIARRVASEREPWPEAMPVDTSGDPASAVRVILDAAGWPGRAEPGG